MSKIFEKDPIEQFTKISFYLLDHIMPTIKPAAWKILCLIIRKAKGQPNIPVRITFEEFGQKTGIVSSSTVNVALKQLISDGYISVLADGLSPEIAVEGLRASKKPQTVRGCKVVCEWCGGSTYRLQSHHYPIPSKEGGSAIVKICANCHDEYHYLVDQTAYVLSSKLFGGDNE